MENDPHPVQFSVPYKYSLEGARLAVMKLPCSSEHCSGTCWRCSAERNILWAINATGALVAASNGMVGAIDAIRADLGTQYPALSEAYIRLCMAIHEVTGERHEPGGQNETH